MAPRHGQWRTRIPRHGQWRTRIPRHGQWRTRIPRHGQTQTRISAPRRARGSRLLAGIRRQTGMPGLTGGSLSGVPRLADVRKLTFQETGDQSADHGRHGESMLGAPLPELRMLLGREPHRDHLLPGGHARPEGVCYAGPALPEHRSCQLREGGPRRLHGPGIRGRRGERSAQEPGVHQVTVSGLQRIHCRNKKLNGIFWVARPRGGFGVAWLLGHDWLRGICAEPRAISRGISRYRPGLVSSSPSRRNSMIRVDWWAYRGCRLTRARLPGGGFCGCLAWWLVAGRARWGVWGAVAGAGGRFSWLAGRWPAGRRPGGGLRGLP
jgi:hypothetical protein